MACKNHTIKVSDETWAAWSAHAESLGLSITKMLCRSVLDSKEKPVPRMLGINQQRDMPDAPQVPEKYVPQPQLKDKWKAKK